MSGGLVGDTGLVRCIIQLGKAGMATKKVAIVELTCIATALYFIQEESREYDIFLKLLKRNMNVRLKILCFDWFQT